jgi:hypothetical protein
VGAAPEAAGAQRGGDDQREAVAVVHVGSPWSPDGGPSSASLSFSR